MSGKSKNVQNFNLNDRVFAKMKSYPIWPAKIIEIIGSNKFKVFFYGTHDCAIVPKSNVTKYDSMKNNIPSSKLKSYLSAVKEIKQDVNNKLFSCEKINRCQKAASTSKTPNKTVPGNDVKTSKKRKISTSISDKAGPSKKPKKSMKSIDFSIFSPSELYLECTTPEQVPVRMHIRDVLTKDIVDKIHHTDPCHWKVLALGVINYIRRKIINGGPVPHQVQLNIDAATIQHGIASQRSMSSNGSCSSIIALDTTEFKETTESKYITDCKDTMDSKDSSESKDFTDSEDATIPENILRFKGTTESEETIESKGVLDFINTTDSMYIIESKDTINFKDTTESKDITNSKDIIDSNDSTESKFITNCEDITESKTINAKDISDSNNITEFKDITNSKDTIISNDNTEPKIITNCEESKDTTNAKDISDSNDLTESKEITNSKDIIDSNDNTKSKIITNSKDTTEPKDTANVKVITDSDGVSEFKIITNSKDSPDSMYTTEFKETINSKDTIESNNTTNSKDTTYSNDIKKSKSIIIDSDATSDSKHTTDLKNTTSTRKCQGRRHSKKRKTKKVLVAQMTSVNETKDSKTECIISKNKTLCKNLEEDSPIGEKQRFEKQPLLKHKKCSKKNTKLEETISLNNEISMENNINLEENIATFGQSTNSEKEKMTKEKLKLEREQDQNNKEKNKRAEKHTTEKKTTKEVRENQNNKIMSHDNNTCLISSVYKTSHHVEISRNSSEETNDVKDDENHKNMSCTGSATNNTPSSSDDKRDNSFIEDNNEPTQSNSQRLSPTLCNEKLLAKYINYYSKRKLKLDLNEINNLVRKNLENKQEQAKEKYESILNDVEPMHQVIDANLAKTNGQHEDQGTKKTDQTPKINNTDLIDNMYKETVTMSNPSIIQKEPAHEFPTLDLYDGLVDIDKVNNEHECLSTSTNTQNGYLEERNQFLCNVGHNTDTAIATVNNNEHMISNHQQYPYITKSLEDGFAQTTCYPQNIKQKPLYGSSAKIVSQSTVEDSTLVHQNILQPNNTQETSQQCCYSETAHTSYAGIESTMLESHVQKSTINQSPLSTVQTSTINQRMSPLDKSSSFSNQSNSPQVENSSFINQSVSPQVESSTFGNQSLSPHIKNLIFSNPSVLPQVENPTLGNQVVSPQVNNSTFSNQSGSQMNTEDSLTSNLSLSNDSSDLSEAELNDLVSTLFFKESQALLLHVNLMKYLRFNKNQQSSVSAADLYNADFILAELHRMKLNQFVLLRNPQLVFTARLIATSSKDLIDSNNNNVAPKQNHINTWKKSYCAENSLSNSSDSGSLCFADSSSPAPGSEEKSQCELYRKQLESTSLTFLQYVAKVLKFNSEENFYDQFNSALSKFWRRTKHMSWSDIIYVAEQGIQNNIWN